MAPSVIDVGNTSGFERSSESMSCKEPLASGKQPRHEEYQYLDLIRDILDDGEHRPDRTGTGTYSLFAPLPLRFTLSRPATPAEVTEASSKGRPADFVPILPLLTTKRVFLRAVIAELLWFLRGSTSALDLAAQNVHIWDGNGSRAFLDAAGLTDRAEGDLGPVYGFQWRHFGAEYRGADADYSGEGVDQLADVVNALIHKPWDRRIVLSAWNPASLKEMALPPCHMFAQFYVSFPGRRRRRGGLSTASEQANGANGSSYRGGGVVHGIAKVADVREDYGESDKASAPESITANGNAMGKERGVLHCTLYQRSADMGLGVPFNIASYALLTHMLAHVCGLTPGTFTHVIGDAHVYVDHVSALESQIEREPRPFPALEIASKHKWGSALESVERKGGVASLEGWESTDFTVNGYEPHKAVAMKMSV